jgi:hypothetical protein
MISFPCTVKMCQPSAISRPGTPVGRRTFGIAAIADASGVCT